MFLGSSVSIPAKTPCRHVQVFLEGKCQESECIFFFLLVAIQLSSKAPNASRPSYQLCVSKTGIRQPSQPCYNQTVPVTFRLYTIFVSKVSALRLRTEHAQVTSAPIPCNRN